MGWASSQGSSSAGSAGSIARAAFSACVTIPSEGMPARSGAQDWSWISQYWALICSALGLCQVARKSLTKRISSGLVAAAGGLLELSRAIAKDRHPLVRADAARAEKLIEASRRRRNLVVHVGVHTVVPVLEGCPAGHDIDMTSLPVRRIAMPEPRGVHRNCAQ